MENLIEKCTIKIKKVRTGLGVSQAKLSKEIGVVQSSISKIENNVQPISSELLIKISKVLQICPYTLISFCDSCSIKHNCKKNHIIEQ